MASIKVFHNGFKVNGEKELYKSYFWLQKDTDGREYVYLSAKDYGNLPRGFFDVRNDTDSQTDYFDSDSAKIYEDHPLFKYVKYASLKSDYMKYKRILKGWKDCYYHHFTKDEYEAKVAEFEALEDVGQPTEDDINAIEVMKARREQDRIEAEKKAEEERQNEYFIERLETEMTIHEYTEKYPLKEGEAYVEIPFSERLGIEHGSKWSLKAGQQIFRVLDEREHAKNEGYDKTDFTIHYPHNGEWNFYRGRYDIGDGEGGLLEHIHNYGEYFRTHGEFGEELKVPKSGNEVLDTWKILVELHDN